MDVDKGLLGKVEYRMKWMGETRKQAEEAISTINKEKTETMLIQQSVMLPSTQQGTDNTSNDNKNTSSDTEAQAENEKRKRANESVETTKSKTEES